MHTLIYSLIALGVWGVCSSAPDAVELSPKGRAAVVALGVALHARPEPCRLQQFDATWWCVKTELEVSAVQGALEHVPQLRRTDPWDDDNSAHFSAGGTNYSSASVVETKGGRTLVWHEIKP